MNADIAISADNTSEHTNAAWVRIPTQMSADRLREFCKDIARLLRINPMLEFIEWKQMQPGRYHMVVQNLSNQQQVDVSFSVTETDAGFVLVYDSGIKRQTKLAVEPTPQGADLVITESYDEVDEGARPELLNEVDKSLTIWARDLQVYIHRWHRWSWLLPWRWYMLRVWQPMKPSARRITYMLLWISVAEIVAFLLIFAIFVLEVDKYFSL